MGNTFLSNGLGTVSNNDHSIFLDLTLNETGPNVIGNESRGANGADIRTTSTTNRLRVVGNDWTKAPTTPSTIFGVEPDVYVGNSDQGGRCAASVYTSTSQTSASGTELTVSFNQDSYGPRGQAVHDVTSNNSRLKIPASGSGAAGAPKSISGFYTISAGVEFASNGAGLRQLKILKNGATVLAYDNRTPVPGGFPTRLSLTHQALLVEGDYIEVVVYQNSGGNLDVSAGADRTWFSMAKTL